MYIGASGKARTVSKAYVGVSGKAKTASKIYLGVGGKAKLAWQALPTKQSLEEMSWSDIQRVCRAGKGMDYFSLGETKSISFGGEGGPYKVQIIGFNHDDVSSPSSYGREKAGITFAFGVCGASAQASGLQSLYRRAARMNTSTSNIGGWVECEMRLSTMPQMKAYLPEELRNVIVPVKKKTSAGNNSNSIVTTTDDLFLLSEMEQLGTALNSYPGEGTRYEYFETEVSENTSLRYNWNGEESDYPFRSPASYSSSDFACVKNGSHGEYPANTELYFTFAFCV